MTLNSDGRALSSSAPFQGAESLHSAEFLHGLASYLLRLDVRGIEELQSLWKCWFILFRLFRTPAQVPNPTTSSSAITWNQQHQDFIRTALTPIWNQARHQLEAATDSTKLKRHHLARTVSRALTELLTISDEMGVGVGEMDIGRQGSLSLTCAFIYMYMCVYWVDDCLPACPRLVRIAADC